jgi:hypothetical protein
LSSRGPLHLTLSSLSLSPTGGAHLSGGRLLPPAAPSSHGCRPPPPAISAPLPLPRRFLSSTGAH